MLQVLKRKGSKSSDILSPLMDVAAVESGGEEDYDDEDGSDDYYDDDDSVSTFQKFNSLLISTGALSLRQGS